MIGIVCKEQALAHRHVAEVVDNLAALTENGSLLTLIKVISTTMRPTVPIKIPEVDDMIARAQKRWMQSNKQIKKSVSCGKSMR